MTTETTLGVLFALLIAGFLLFFTAATIKHLVLPAVWQPTFALKPNLLDLLGALAFAQCLITFLNAYFSSDGLLAVLSQWAIYAIASLGLFGMVIVLVIGLAARFFLRIALLFLRRT